FFFFQAEDGIRDFHVTGVQTCALPILPLLVADAEAGVVGAAHSGRPGMAAGVVSALLAEMARHGARPERCAALLGPVICGRCYEIGRASCRERGESVVVVVLSSKTKRR